MLTYEEFGQLPADRSVIPASCISFSESAMYVADAAQRYFNEFYEQIGIEELAIFESTGSVVVYEGARLQAFKEAVAKIFENIWKAIKSAYEKIMAKIDEIRRKMAQKYLKVTAADVKAIPDEKFNNTLGKFKYQKYKDVEKEIEGKIKAETAESKLPNFSGYKDADLEKAQDATKTFIDGLYSRICNAICGKKAESAEAMQKVIAEACKDGKETELKKSWLAANVDSMNKRTDKALGSVRKKYRDTKAALHQATRSLNKIGDDNLSIGQCEVRCKRTNIVAMHSAYMTTVDAQMAEMKQDLHVLKMLTNLSSSAKKAAKREEKKAKNESASFVEEAFDWE